jgi:hypothetical protein
MQRYYTTRKVIPRAIKMLIENSSIPSAEQLR